MALTGLDFHQLDSFEGFHQLISDPPFPRFSQRDSPGFRVANPSTQPVAERAELTISQL
jgi:hypothetical protein